MALIKPFKALRPRPDEVLLIASPPYDVLSSDEAREMAHSNEISFLRISKPEVDFGSDTDEHDPEVYEQGKKNLDWFMHEKHLIQEQKPCYYIYRQIMGFHMQTGLVACASVDDYQKEIIKKHELTRQDKEDDRMKHIDTLDANDEPVFYTYTAKEAIDELVQRITSGKKPVYDFATGDAVKHILWVVDDDRDIASFTEYFRMIPNLYVADGHHRSAAASRVRELRKSKNPAHAGNEEYNWFLVVIFPHNQMQILEYNRAVKDLNQHTVGEFFSLINKNFMVTETSQNKPPEKHSFCMYLDKKWYVLRAKEGSFDQDDVVCSLDVSILQNNLLNPVLGIKDPRTDKRIHFIGGIRGVSELERVVDSGVYRVAFSMYPTTIDDLMKLADRGEIMPPKSTWFEPKLRSGLFLHKLT
jgi:uncharacterized protein (DUF1015 family)